MAKDTKLVHGYEEIELSELDTMAVELPDRVALSLVNANLAVPINAAVAANVLSDNAAAGAFATQQTPILQGTGPMMFGGQ
jgi:hypothetical protein